jgi:hypothetical protein
LHQGPPAPRGTGPLLFGPAVTAPATPRLTYAHAHAHTHAGLRAWCASVEMSVVGAIAHRQWSAQHNRFGSKASALIAAGAHACLYVVCGMWCMFVCVVCGVCCTLCVACCTMCVVSCVLCGVCSRDCATAHNRRGGGDLQVGRPVGLSDGTAKPGAALPCPALRCCLDRVLYSLLPLCRSAPSVRPVPNPTFRPPAQRWRWLSVGSALAQPRGRAHSRSHASRRVSTHTLSRMPACLQLGDRRLRRAVAL